MLLKLLDNNNTQATCITYNDSLIIIYNAAVFPRAPQITPLKKKYALVKFQTVGNIHIGCLRGLRLSA